MSKLKKGTKIWSVVVVWGEDPNLQTTETYEFATKAELKAFLLGAKQSNGWMEYSVDEIRELTGNGWVGYSDVEADVLLENC